MVDKSNLGEIAPVATNIEDKSQDLSKSIEKWLENTKDLIQDSKEPSTTEEPTKTMSCTPSSSAPSTGPTSLSDVEEVNNIISAVPKEDPHFAMGHSNNS